MSHHTLNILISCTIFITTYIFIILDKYERSIVAMSGAMLMILVKILSQKNAFKEIDYNTLGLLISIRKKLITTKEAKLKVITMDEKAVIKDKLLLKKSSLILGLTIIGFMLHGVLHYESATIAITCAVGLLLISGINPEKIFHEVEYNILLCGSFYISWRSKRNWSN
jgi:Na+/H+ antiporter NhaD/arsenite permease-like protein